MKENRNPSMSRSMGKGFPHVHRPIVVKISFFTAFAFVILVGLLTGYSIYSIQTASHNIREQQLRVMRVHTQQITTAAENATASLNELVISNLDEISRIAEVDSYRRYLASLAIVSDFDVKVQNNSQLACVYFVYEEQPLFLYRFDGSMGWQKKINLEDYLQGAPELESDVVTGAWHILKLGSDCYLQQNYRIGPGYLGVLLSLETLLEGRQGEESAESIYLFTDEDSRVLISENDVEFSMGDTVKNSETYVPAGNGDYVMFTQEVGVAGLRLSCAVPSEDVYAGMQRMQYLRGGIALGALLLVVLLGIYLHRYCKAPSNPGFGHLPN